jgi:hypothetical protein
MGDGDADDVLRVAKADGLGHIGAFFAVGGDAIGGGINDNPRVHNLSP